MPTIAVARLLVRALLVACVGCSAAIAAEIVQRNPFDPQRRPWLEPPPPLPALTSGDLQVEAIISFGAQQVIVAQLEGRLKGALPANAAGKVRISLGQRFGEGYVLERIEPSQVVIQGGSARYYIPLLRRNNRGAAPAPAVSAAGQIIVTTVAGTAPGAEGSAVATAMPPEAGAPPPPIEPTRPSVVAPSAAMSPAAMSAAATNPAPTPSGQPVSLVEAIRQAQEAARARQNSAPANPFARSPRN